MAYTTTWDETTPAGTEARSLGDDRIKELKKQIRERMEDKIVTDWDSDPVLQKIVPTAVPFLLYADVAPTGWTIYAGLDDKLVYITKGSAAGGRAGGAEYSGGSWTISGLTADAHTHTGPSHTHPYSVHTRGGPSSNNYGLGDYYPPENTEAAGTGNTGAASANGVTHTPGWRPAAYCWIPCTKD
jgi:hypothetical protein